MIKYLGFVTIGLYLTCLICLWSAIHYHRPIIPFDSDEAESDIDFLQNVAMCDMMSKIILALIRNLNGNKDLANVIIEYVGSYEDIDNLDGLN